MNCFGIFAKYWQPGQVKTRLAASLGEEAASDVYRQFVATLLKRFECCGDRRILAFTPAERSNDFESLAGGQWETTPQSEGDLGQRMAAYFASCFDNGADRVVLIGSDSPTMPKEFVELAFDSLSNHDVVLGPTNDGGYYLVGTSNEVGAMFEQIDWSTPRVWAQTVARLAELNLSYTTLPKWYDVDELSDLKRLRDELSASESNDEALHDLQLKIQSVLPPAREQSDV